MWWKKWSNLGDFTWNDPDTCGKMRARASLSRILPIVLRLEMGLRLERSDFDKPCFFKRGEISASLNLVGKVAWENDRFARWEMRREKVDAHDFKREVGI